MFVSSLTIALTTMLSAGPDLDKSPQGTVWIANRVSGTVSVIDVRRDEVVQTLELPGAERPEPMYVFYSQRTDRVFVGDRGNDRVVAFDATTREIVGEASAGEGVFHMWGSPATAQLWVNNDVDNTTSIIDMRTLETVGAVDTPADLVAMGGKPHDVIVSPLGLLAYVTVIGVDGDTDWVVQYDTLSGEEIGRAEVGDDPHLSIAYGTRDLYVPAQGGDAVHVLDRLTLDEKAVIAVDNAHGAGMDLDGRTFFTTNIAGGGDGGLVKIDTRTMEVVAEPTDTPFPTPHNIALTPSGNKLYVTHSGMMADRVSIYRAAGRRGQPRLIGEVTVGRNPFGLAYVP
ncbi:MAG: hypothetical protein RIE32_06620 [Phycisphaerales bacterium]